MNKKKICSAVTAAVCLSGVLAAMPQLTAPTYAASVVSNDFEVTYEGWHGTTADFSIEAADGAGFRNSRGMAVTNRNTPADGAASSKGLWLEGGVNYTYNLKVFSKTNETFRLTLMYKDLDTNEETTVELADKDVKAGKWTDLSTSFKAPENTYEYLLTLTTDSTNDFWFDDVLITQQKKFGTAQAAPAGKGLKDEFAKYFRVGNILNGGTVTNSAITAIMLKDHNAIECENETKPSDTLVQNGSTDTNVKVSLNRCAAIADFAQKNGLGFRGHTLVWHSQTPEWFFRQNFNDNGAYVNSSTMDQRMESYIQNMFNAFKTQYPSLDLYAYDVCNEVINDGTARQGGLRPTNGTNGQNGSSAWVKVYGNNSFVEKAFTYARKYAPPTCKLFYNDYNEFATDKQNCIIDTILTPLKAKGLIDGMGMQSHLNCAASGAWGDTNSYLAAMDRYLNLGLDVQVTELDLARNGSTYSDQQQADKYKAIFKHCMDWNINHPDGANVTLVQVWGPNDNNSWVKTDDQGRPNYPLLYDGSNQPKLAYSTLTGIVPDSDWGEGIPYTGPGSTGYVPTPPTPVEPDANGYYFHHTFEEGDNDWAGRGAASVAQSSKAGYKSSNSLYCSGRTATWNGAELVLPSNPFKAGESFSFSVNAMTNEGGSTSNFKLTLQYNDASGKATYAEIAATEAPKGEWVQLANTSYKIPSDASDLHMYVEITDEDSLIDFYIDEAIGAVDGTVISGATPPRPTETSPISTSLPSGVRLGDANCDTLINIADAVLIMQVATNPDKYAPGKTSSSISELGAINGDVDGSKGLTNKDALIIQKYKLGLVSEFTSPYEGEITVNTTEAPQNTTSAVTSTVTTVPYTGSYMKQIQSNMKLSAPSGFDQKKGGVDYGKMEKVTYFSKAANGNKSMNVILPPGYNSNEKYPVLYALHGIGGNEESMPGMGIQNMLGNAIAEGLCEKMIIVCPDMLTGPGNRFGFDQASMRSYDLIREDIIGSIMPYMEEHYSIKTGRDNTAISGFSLGGREALFTGITKSEYFGYIGGACPAPGIFATTDKFMTHEGSLKSESEFVPATKPYMLLISSAGDSDGVVTGYPESYDKALTNNNVEHLFQTIPNAGHDNSTVTPHFYNFLRYVFKAV